MAYIEKYHAIVKTMLDFEKNACDFYLSLSTNPNMSSIKRLLKQIAYEKAKELDIFAGMITVSSFLLGSNSQDSELDPDSQCLNVQEPQIYNNSNVNQITGENSPQRSLARIIKLEKEVLAFYRKLRKNVLTNVKQIDSLIARQQRQIATLISIKEGMLENRITGPAGTEQTLATELQQSA